jgi:superfamily I DNA/RNA helicase
MELIERFQAEPETLRLVSQRFQHIIIDDVQDLSELQWRLIKLLVVESQNPNCIFTGLGDDDQSIF